MKNLFFKSIRSLVGGMIVLADRLLPPRAMKHGAKQQKAINESAQYLALYEFPSCPFCIRVRRHSRRLGIPLITRNVLKNESWHQELETLGGKRKVPCLRIEDQPGEVQWLYESKAINAYLTERFEALSN